MFSNVNLSAPLGALALLGAGFLSFVAVVVLVQSLLARKRRRARLALFGLALIVIVYVATMLGFSFLSHETVLARGQEKHFCELDCHLAYSVVNETQAKTFSQGPSQLSAQGQFTVVTIQTRFDDKTTAPGRGDGLLYPNGRTVSLIDASGRRYPAVAQAGTQLTTPVRPGESYTTDLVFDLPVNAKPAALQLNESAWETHFIIGHENSPLHKKTMFQV